MRGEQLRHNGGHVGAVPVIGAQKTFEVSLNDAPMAFPTSQLVPHGGGATLQIFGGLSKFEYFLGQVMANPAYHAHTPAELIDRVQSVCNALEESRGTKEGTN